MLKNTTANQSRIGANRPALPPPHKKKRKVIRCCRMVAVVVYLEGRSCPSGGRPSRHLPSSARSSPAPPRRRRLSGRGKPLRRRPLAAWRGGVHVSLHVVQRDLRDGVLVPQLEGDQVPPQGGHGDAGGRGGRPGSAGDGDGLHYAQRQEAARHRQSNRSYPATSWFVVVMFGCVETATWHVCLYAHLSFIYFACMD